MKRVGDLLSALFDENFLEKTRGYSAFFDCWEDLMLKNGIAAAGGHSWIKSVEKGLVWIEVDHPGWKQILQTKESKLLHDFRYRFPDMGISGISIVLCKPGTGIGGRGSGIREEREEKKEEQETPAEQAKASVVTSTADETRDTRRGEIKDKALNEILDRLEKHIAESEITDNK